MREQRKSPAGLPVRAVSAVGTGLLAAFFINWCVSGAGMSLPGFFAALLSAIIFELLCLRFVPAGLDFCLGAPPPKRAKGGKKEPERMGLRIFLALLLVNTAALAGVYLIRRFSGQVGSFIQELQFWRCLDSQSYLDIAQDWYLSQGAEDRLVQLVFLPGYPLAIRLVKVLVGDWLYSAFLVSLLSFSGAGCLIYRLLRLDYSHEQALRALIFLCLMPGAFFFAAPMSESLFLLLCAACLYCARTKKWLAGCLFGALAVFTRSLGLTLLAPLVMELLREAAAKRPLAKAEKRGLLLKSLALLIVPMGFAAYCLINYQVSGEPFKFMEYQRSHWFQQLGWFFNTASYQTDWAIWKFSDSIHDFLGLWLPNLIVGYSALLIMWAAAKKLRPSYTGWFIGYYLIAMGATWLLSAPRYMAAFFPLPLALSLLSEKPWARRTLYALCLIAELLYTYAFALRWQVW